MMIRLLTRVAAVIFATLLSVVPGVLWAQAVPESPSGTPIPSRATTVQTPSPRTATDPAPSSKNGETPSLPGGHPLASLLGMTLKTATADFGAPEEVFPVRGKKAWEDDVVFYYRDHSYLFWFRDRVWQVRVDRRFTGTVLGLHMGDSKETVAKALGKPFYVGGESEIFILPNRGFPVRARLFFTDGGLSDLYVYRGDF